VVSHCHPERRGIFLNGIRGQLVAGARIEKQLHSRGGTEFRGEAENAWLSEVAEDHLEGFHPCSAPRPRATQQLRVSAVRFSRLRLRTELAATR
jgi:hypothetical protein